MAQWDDRNRRQEDENIGRRGGYAEARPVYAESTGVGSYVVSGIVGGLIAGVVFWIMEMIGAAVMGMSALVPVRMFASILLGQAALPGEAASIGSIVIAAIVAYFVIAAAWGAVFGLIIGVTRTRMSLWVTAFWGFVFGIVVWLVDFYIFAPIAWPWFVTETNPIIQFLMHAFFYGLPLGLWVGYQTKNRLELTS